MSLAPARREQVRRLLEEYRSLVQLLAELQQQRAGRRPSPTWRTNVPVAA